MMAIRTLLAVALCAVALSSGCDSSVPEVSSGPEITIPSQGPPLKVHLAQAPSASDATSVEGKTSLPGTATFYATAAATSTATECTGWVTDLEKWDETTGDFESRYSCPSGGDVASVVTIGKDDLAGNGAYKTTYTLRDSSQVIWSFTYTTAADGVTQTTSGSSNEGESMQSTTVYLPNGDIQSRETWQLAEGSFVIDGVYAAKPDALGGARFNGEYTFDDPATAESPDWTVDQSHAADGTITQVGSQTLPDWEYAFTYTVDPSNNVTFEYSWDAPASSANPDYAGKYSYAPGGAATGSYTQKWDDGSKLVVSHSFDWQKNDGYTESWVFDDATTAQPKDQEGELVYDAQGNGKGTLTTHIVGGGTETCDIEITATGTTTLTNCQQS
jgi:hypothetical protein